MDVRLQYDRSFFSRPVQMLLLELWQIGEVCIEADSVVEAHRQSCYEISYIVSGQGEFCHGDTVLAVAAGDIVVTPCRGIHTIRAAADEPLFYAYMGFRFLDGAAAFSPAPRAFFEDGIGGAAPQAADLYPVFRQCIDEFFRSDVADLLMVESGLIQLIVRTYRHFCGIPDAGIYPPGQPTPGQLVYRITKYVESHLTEPLSVSAIAAALGYSPCYISHLFRERMDKTLQEYVSTCKAQKAAELLTLDRYTVTQVAELLGYQSPRSFSRAFSRVHGCAPSAFAAKKP